MAKRNSTPEISRFLSQVDKSGECWVWTGPVTEKGYGRFGVNNTRVRAHRYAYQHYVGDIGAGNLVCHKCDNPGCVNPDHLFVGLPSDNSADMVSKGRQTKGEKNPQAKLSESQVVEIRRMVREGYGKPTIAAQFNISEVTVSDIVKRTWRHVKG